MTFPFLFLMHFPSATWRAFRILFIVPVEMNLSKGKENKKMDIRTKHAEDNKKI
jgi:hypothetical protein